MIVLYPHQNEVENEVLNCYKRGFNSVLLVLPTGAGKCLAKGTNILMFDGSIKKVEDVNIGDVLMGDDSTPRNVLTTCNGSEMMYDIMPSKGEKYTVNESHILSLIDNNNNKIDIDVISYLNHKNKNTLFGYRVPNILINDLSIEKVYISVVPTKVDEYFGFEIDGNRRFVLGDFTVTHNTVVFCDVAKKASLKNKRVLILVHRIELVRQTSKSLHKSGVEHGIINPEYTPDLSQDVQVASVQTLVNRLDKYDDFDFIIIDEAHHSIAGNWMKIISYYNRAKILGVTATPCRADGKGLDNIFQTMVVGPQIGKLIDMGFLVKPLVFCPKVKMDFSHVSIVGSDYDKEELVSILDRPTITGDAVAHYRKLCSGAPTVVFCVNVSHAEHVAEEFRQAGFRAYSVDGSMSDDMRSRILDGLGNGQVEVVTSCDLISEGTDIPAITCVIKLRPTHSLSLNIQQDGRALRTLEGKEFAYILDHVGNTFEHGPIDMEREWTLEGRKKRTKKQVASEKTIAIKQCGECFAVFEPRPVCPSCGFIEPEKEISLNQVDGELEILDSEAQKEFEKKLKRNKIASAITMDDLRKVAKDLGYNWQWAKRIYDARGGDNHSRIKQKAEFEKII